MIAHLYLCGRSFRWNGQDKLADFQLKMALFQKMLAHIVMYPDDNSFYLHKESFLGTRILENVFMSEILLDFDKAKTIIGMDAYSILMGILKHCMLTQATIKDLRSYLSLEDENNCHAIVVFSPFKRWANHLQVVSTEQGWFKFRRHYLGKYPKDPDFFLNESKKYYPRLNLHPDNAVTIRDVIHTHPMQIVSYLAALNDHFADDFLSSNKDLNEYLPLFAREYKLDDASLEGNKDKKFYFNFREGGQVHRVYCEAHLKMYHDDRGNDNQHCRIYFKKPINGESYIYVGYIGKHL